MSIRRTDPKAERDFLARSLAGESVTLVVAPDGSLRPKGDEDATAGAPPEPAAQPEGGPDPA